MARHFEDASNMTAKHQVCDERCLSPSLNHEEYLAIVKEFDGLWACSKSTQKQERMDELMKFIHAFDASFVEKN